MKTENLQNVGKHAFEVAGLGLAPFRFIGASENVITYPDGTQKAGGSCDYCGTGIRTECWVKSSDGKQFKVGCNCIEKVGDKGLMQAYKNSPEYRQHQRELRAAKDAKITAQLKSLIDANRTLLATMPHPMGFTNRQTGQPLTYLDQVEWYFNNCGATGRADLLKGIQRKLSQALAAH